VICRKVGKLLNNIIAPKSGIVLLGIELLPFLGFNNFLLFRVEIGIKLKLLSDSDSNDLNLWNRLKP
jgi:hypothetical protein